MSEVQTKQVKDADNVELLEVLRQRGLVLIAWGVSDVESLLESQEQPPDIDPANYLAWVSNDLQDRSIERGWGVLEDLLSTYVKEHPPAVVNRYPADENPLLEMEHE